MTARRRATPACGASSAIASNARCARTSRASRIERERLAQFLLGHRGLVRTASLLLDAGDQIEWCNSQAADHFGLDPLRDRRQRVTNLVRVPAFVAHLQSRRVRQPVRFAAPRGQGHAVGAGPSLRRAMRLVLSQDITEQERAEGRRDFVANVSHEIRTPLTVLAGFVETLGGLPSTRPSASACLGADAATDRAHAGPGRRPADAGQARRQPAPGRRALGPCATLMTRAESDAKALSAGRHALASRTDRAGPRSPGATPSCSSALGNL